MDWVVVVDGIENWIEFALMDRNVDSCGVDWVEALHLIRLIASIFEFVQLDRLNSCLRIPTKDLEESLRTLSKRETGNHPERIPLIGSRVGKTILKNPLPPPKKKQWKRNFNRRESCRIVDRRWGGGSRQEIGNRANFRKESDPYED